MHGMCGLCSKNKGLVEEVLCNFIADLKTVGSGGWRVGGVCKLEGSEWLVCCVRCCLQFGRGCIDISAT